MKNPKNLNSKTGWIKYWFADSDRPINRLIAELTKFSGSIIRRSQLKVEGRIRNTTIHLVVMV